MQKLFIITLLSLGMLTTTGVVSKPLPPHVNETLELNRFKYEPDLVVVGNIQVSISEKIQFKPDTTDFSITYVTEGKTPNEASNRNANNMKKFTNFLSQLGFSNDNLTTVSYRNYERKIHKPVEENELQLYQSSLMVSTFIYDSKFQEVLAILEQQGIDNIAKYYSNNKIYNFTITEKASQEAHAKQLAQEKYKKIVEQLKPHDIQLSIDKYENTKLTPKTRETKGYYVENILNVRVTQLAQLGKIYF